MNIFLTSFNPIECARDLDTRRLSKMILETTQLLSTAKHYRVKDWEFCNDNPVYKPTHKNHPCAIWVRECIGNYMFTLNLLQAYSAEYLKRKSKLHKSIIDHWDTGNILIRYWEGNQDTTPFPNCAKSKEKGLDFTHLPIVEAYQKYLTYQWFNTDKYKPSWLGDYIPEFAREYLTQGE